MRGRSTTSGSSLKRLPVIHVLEVWKKAMSIWGQRRRLHISCARVLSLVFYVCLKRFLGTSLRNPKGIREQTTAGGQRNGAYP